MGRTEANEQRTIGKIKYFRENRLEVRQIKVFLMLAVSGWCVDFILKSGII
jgi:hypothetical protein